jgi:hypothetical protein
LSVSAVAEHFIYFLVSKAYMEDGYCINKKKLKDIFKDEYIPLYHVRMRPYFIIQCLAVNKYVKKQRKSAVETVFFIGSKVQTVVAKFGERRQGNTENTTWCCVIAGDLYTLLL